MIKKGCHDSKMATSFNVLGIKCQYICVNVHFAIYEVLGCGFWALAKVAGPSACTKDTTKVWKR